MSESSKVPFNSVFWPALVAIVIALFLGMLFFLLVLGGIIGSFKDFGPEPYSVQTGSVLKMKLGANIQEKSNSEFDPQVYPSKAQSGCRIFYLPLTRPKRTEG